MPTSAAQAPAFDTARAFDAEAFDHKKKRVLTESIAESSEMTENEQSFTVVHLPYLNLQTQAAGQRLLAQVRELPDEVAESLTTAIEASLRQERDEAEEPEDGFDAEPPNWDSDGFRVEPESPALEPSAAEVRSDPGRRGARPRGEAIGVNVTVPVTRIGCGPFTMDPLEQVIGAKFAGPARARHGRPGLPPAVGGGGCHRVVPACAAGWRGRLDPAGAVGRGALPECGRAARDHVALAHGALTLSHATCSPGPGGSRVLRRRGRPGPAHHPSARPQDPATTWLRPVDGDPPRNLVGAHVPGAWAPISVVLLTQKHRTCMFTTPRRPVRRPFHLVGGSMLRVNTLAAALISFGLAAPQAFACPAAADYSTDTPLLFATIPASDVSPVSCGTAGSGVGTSACADIKVYVPAVGEPMEYPLFVLLPGSGMSPALHELVLRTAAYAGYRTIGLSYMNVGEVADECDDSAFELKCSTNCAYKVRKERITGVNDNITPFNMVSEDSILTRLVYVLGRLQSIDNSGSVSWDNAGDDYGWGNYCPDVTYPVGGPGSGGHFSMSDIAWQDVIIAGFSQGSGHAALIALENQVEGFGVLDGPNDRCFDDVTQIEEMANYYSNITNQSALSNSFAALHEDSSPIVPDPYSYLGLSTTAQDWDATAPTLSSDVISTDQTTATIGNFSCTPTCRWPGSGACRPTRPPALPRPRPTTCISSRRTCRGSARSRCSVRTRPVPRWR